MAVIKIPAACCRSCQNCSYKEIDGVAMGSPLAPALADIFINWVVDEVIKKSNKSSTIYRYVDSF